jgi:chemotaxis protein CheD
VPGSPQLSAIASLFAQRVVIGVGDLAVSNNQQTVLSTYALGSCIGVAVYDPEVRAGGILHLMLPESKISPGKAAAQPAMFADTGLPMLFRKLTGFQVAADRLVLFVAGGASVIQGTDPFRIGERNIRATLDYLQQHGYNVRASQTGGSINRTIHLEVSTGMLLLKTAGSEQKLSLAD